MEQSPNEFVILGCYKNALTTNVKYAIKSSHILILE